MACSQEPGASPGRAPRARVLEFLALGLLAALPCAGARADWEVGAAAGAIYDDNLTRAQNHVDKRAAGAVTATVSGTNFVPLTGSDGMTFMLYAHGELFDRFHGL